MSCSGLRPVPGSARGCSPGGGAGAVPGYVTGRARLAFSGGRWPPGARSSLPPVSSPSSPSRCSWWGDRRDGSGSAGHGGPDPVQACGPGGVIKHQRLALRRGRHLRPERLGGWRNLIFHWNSKARKRALAPPTAISKTWPLPSRAMPGRPATPVAAPAARPLSCTGAAKRRSGAQPGPAGSVLYGVAATALAAPGRSATPKAAPAVSRP